MAATRGSVQWFGKDGDPQSGQATRLGHGSVKAQADTWRTFTTCSIWADGSGYVEVTRNGKSLHRFEFGPEGADA